MTAPDRIPCIVPGCRRTAPLKKYGPGVEIVCGKCWRELVPPRLKNAYKRLKALQRRIKRKKEPRPDLVAFVERQRQRNWQEIRTALIQPERPAGLDAFLEETGL